MLKLLALLFVLSTTAYADGNGIERGSYRGENPLAKIPANILDMIESEVLKRCHTSHLSFIRVESVEVQKIGVDQFITDTTYTVVLWAPGIDQLMREHIYVKVIDASASISSPYINPVSIDVSSVDVICE